MTAQVSTTDSKSLRELSLKVGYRSDENNLIDDFYVPCLRRSVLYQRAVGYFTSAGFAAAAKGLAAFIQNDGKMQLVASPWFEEEDIQAIQRGYEGRDGILDRALTRQIEAISDELTRNRFECLAWLVSTGQLEIKVALRTNNDGEIVPGLYHEKVGIFTDEAGNAVAFSGSPNETAGGLVNNFEAIDVYWSWDEDTKRFRWKKEAFDQLWANQTKNLEIEAFPEAARQTLLKHKPRRIPSRDGHPRRSNSHRRDHQPFDDESSYKWRHQDEAIREFMKTERGVLEMATGTGKTRTALRICKHLINNDAVESIIVTTDGTDLLHQWNLSLLEYLEEFKEFFTISRHYGSYHQKEFFEIDPKYSILLVSRPQLASTLRHLSRQDAQKTILIHDEVHRLGSPGNRNALEGLSDHIRFRLGLSATPDREYDEEGNAFIEGHIGPVLYEFQLDDAIRRGILAPFNYFPLQYCPDENDRKRIQQVFSKVERRRREGRPMTKEEIWIELARVHKTSHAKIPVFEEFIEQHPELLERCIVFVETQEYGQEILEIIHNHRADFRTYFSGEDASTLERFARGDIECLMTCHRLSEGIDIKSLKNVILFSSARARLETIQRMGRCLRTNPDEPTKRANVVDFIRVDDDEDTEERNADELRREWLEELSMVEPEE